MQVACVPMCQLPPINRPTCTCFTWSGGGGGEKDKPNRGLKDNAMGVERRAFEWNLTD